MTRTRLLIVAAVLIVPALASSFGHAVAPPVMVTAVTKDAGNGRLDRIELSFSAAMNTNQLPRKSSGPGDPGFYLSGGYTIDRFVWDSTTVLSIHLVEKSVPDTAVVPTVTYVDGGGGAQLAGFPTVEASPGSPQQSLDGAGPALLSFTVNDRGSALLFNAGGDTAYLRFSEAVSLVGQTKLDRWSNLEKAIKFENDSGCQTDGNGGNTDFNFPQPKVSGATDPISSPTPYLLQVTYTPADHIGSSRLIPGVPTACWVGIDPSGTTWITDAIGNAASAMSATHGTKLRIYPIDAAPSSVKTVDGFGGAAPDAVVDAIRVTLDQNLDDATITANLSRFALSLGGTPVEIAGWDTGATADDASFSLLFTAGEGQDWHSGVQPTLAYAEPEDCTPSAGTGVKARVPTGGSWRTCLGSFSLQVADGAPPMLKTSKTLDADGDGLIDDVRVTFTEALATGNNMKAGWTLAGRAASAFTLDAADASKATITFPEGTEGTGDRPTLTYGGQTGQNGVYDNGFNQLLAVNEPVRTDGAAPRIKTVTVYDLSGDGTLDRAVVEFSENMADPSDAAAAAFTVGGTNASGIAAPADGDADPDVANDAIVSLALPSIPGTDAKELAYAGTSVKDLANIALPGTTIAAEDVVDEAAPRATITISPTAPLSTGTSTVTATFSEDMDTSAVPSTATLGTKTLTPVSDADHENGWRIADPRIWDGTVEVESGDCAVSTGCAVTATIDGAADLRGKAQATATKDTEIDTIAPQEPVLSAFTAILPAGETVPANVVNMFTTGFTVEATVAAGDAAGGTAEILVDGQELETPALDEAIADADVSVVPTTAFANAGELQAAIAEQAEPHTLTVRLCDDAANCTTSTTSISITADYTPVPVTVTAPAGGMVARGGSSVDIAWDGDEAADGFDHVDLQYSTNNGASYSTIAGGLTTVDGTYAWTAPSIEDGDVKVRAVAVDVNGNKDADASGAFAVDSTAPVVTILSPTSSNPFLAAGKTNTIRWSVADATVDRVSSPITIEYSYNAGRTWRPINGGSYSKANDGQESWSVPKGGSFSYRLRITATDAVDHVTTVTSTKLAKGVQGYVTGYSGYIYAFGTTSTHTRESLVLRRDWVRGMAMRSDGKSGYVLSSRGYLYPFAVGDAAMPKKPYRRSLRADLARGVALRTNTSGYVLDAYGRLHRWGRAPKARPSKTWVGKNLARDVILLSNKKGGYVLDAYGRLHPFRIGKNPMPRKIQPDRLFSKRKARGVVLRSNQRSGWIMDWDGKLYPFGGAPRVKSTGTGPSAKAIFRVTNYGGYWVDYKGRLHAWGSAFGNPTKVVIKKYWARAAAGM